MRIGVDSGGTFTDVVVFDPATRPPGIPQDRLDAGRSGGGHRPRRAGSRRAGRRRNRPTWRCSSTARRSPPTRCCSAHGARVALITTAGFRDVLHIQRQSRPLMYDLRARRTAPLVPRELRFEVRERMRFDGTVQTPLDRCGAGRRDRRHPRCGRAGGRRGAAAQLRQSQPRAGDRRGGGAPAAGCRRQPVARAHGRARRIRAVQHLRDERLRAAGDRALRHPAGRRVARGRLHGAAVRDEVQRRGHDRGVGRAPLRGDRALRACRRRGRGRRGGAGARGRRT